MCTDDPMHGLLKRMSQGPGATLEQIAADLVVDQALLILMLADLERSGYVRAIGAQCQATCEKCGSAQPCGLLSGARFWMLTDRGQRSATRR